MPLTPTDKFEIKCRVFRAMTGCWPPGKDWPAAAGPRDEEADRKAWDEWREQYEEVIGLVFFGIERYESETESTASRQD